MMKLFNQNVGLEEEVTERSSGHLNLDFLPKHLRSPFRVDTKSIVVLVPHPCLPKVSLNSFFLVLFFRLYRCPSSMFSLTQSYYPAFSLQLEVKGFCRARFQTSFQYVAHCVDKSPQLNYIFQPSLLSQDRRG